MSLALAMSMAVTMVVIKGCVNRADILFEGAEQCVQVYNQNGRSIDTTSVRSAHILLEETEKCDPVSDS